MTTTLPYAMKSQTIQVQENSESETAFIKTLEHDNVQVNVIDLLPQENGPTSHLSGKIVCCLDGEIIITFADGRSMTISKGMLFIMPGKNQSTCINILTGTKLLVISQTLKRKKIERNPWRM